MRPLPIGEQMHANSITSIVVNIICDIAYMLACQNEPKAGGRQDLIISDKSILCECLFKEEEEKIVFYMEKQKTGRHCRTLQYDIERTAEMTTEMKPALRASYI